MEHVIFLFGVVIVFGISQWAWTATPSPSWPLLGASLLAAAILVVVSNAADYKPQAVVWLLTVAGLVAWLGVMALRKRETSPPPMR